MSVGGARGSLSGWARLGRGGLSKQNWTGPGVVIWDPLSWTCRMTDRQNWKYYLPTLLANFNCEVKSVSKQDVFTRITSLSQVRIQDLVKGGPQLLRLKVADVAKWSRASEVSILWPGSRARLRALEAFGFLMLKYAFSHILETLFLLFLTSILTPKVDKNRALDFTSINLRHSDMLHLFFNLHEKVML